MVRLCNRLADILILIIVIAIALFRDPVSAGSPCPSDRWKIYPCSCHEISLQPSENAKRLSFTLVECKNFRSRNDVSNALWRGFSYKSIDRLLFSVSDEYGYRRSYGDRIVISNLPRAIYVRELIFQDQDSYSSKCLWTSRENWPILHESVTKLTVTNCSFSEKRIDDSCMEELSEWIGLHHLIISGNDISYGIKSRFPQELWKVKTLDLSSNELTFIDNGAFGNLTSLEYLNLSRNLLTFSQPLDFYFFINEALVELDLSWNPLRWLPYVLPQGTPNLQKLHLRHTLIHTLHVNYVLETPNLNYIDLTGSLINCNCDMSWTTVSLNSFVSIEHYDSSVTETVETDINTTTTHNFPNEHIVKVEGFCINPISLEFEKIDDPSNYKGCL